MREFIITRLRACMKLTTPPPRRPTTRSIQIPCWVCAIHVVLCAVLCVSTFGTFTPLAFYKVSRFSRDWPTTVTPMGSCLTNKADTYVLTITARNFGARTCYGLPVRLDPSGRRHERFKSAMATNKVLPITGRQGRSYHIFVQAVTWHGVRPTGPTFA